MGNQILKILQVLTLVGTIAGTIINVVTDHMKK
jgi:hypothetical protein